MDKPIATCLVLAALAAGPLIADEGRIPVFAPTVITQPGYYVLTRDISVSGGHVITIQANNVTLDLNGRTIVSSGVGVADDVVLVSTASASGGVTIRNGRIQGGYNGVFSDTGGAVRIRIQEVEIQKSALGGINILSGEQADIEDCYVHDTAASGISVVSVAGTIVDNVVEGVGGFGIAAQGLRSGLILRNVVRDIGSATLNAAGIALFDSSPAGTSGGAVVRGNLVSALPGGTDDDGIRITNGSNYDLVFENDASYNGRYGIWTLGDGTRLERNVASHNGIDGIRIGNAFPTGLRCHLEGNQAEDNSCGIDFVNGPTHSYRNNLLRGNTTPLCGAAGSLDAGGNIL